MIRRSCLRAQLGSNISCWTLTLLRRCQAQSISKMYATGQKRGQRRGFPEIIWDTPVVSMLSVFLMVQTSGKFFRWYVFTAHLNFQDNIPYYSRDQARKHILPVFRCQDTCVCIDSASCLPLDLMHDPTPPSEFQLCCKKPATGRHWGYFACMQVGLPGSRRLDQEMPGFLIGFCSLHAAGSVPGCRGAVPGTAQSDYTVAASCY